jgi:hypothetical protein
MGEETANVRADGNNRRKASGRRSGLVRLIEGNLRLCRRACSVRQLRE